MLLLQVKFGLAYPHGTQANSAVVSLPIVTNHPPTLIHHANQGTANLYECGFNIKRWELLRWIYAQSLRFKEVCLAKLMMSAAEH